MVHQNRPDPKPQGRGLRTWMAATSLVLTLARLVVDLFDRFHR